MTLVVVMTIIMTVAMILELNEIYHGNCSDGILKV